MKNTFHIALLPGDGIGVDVTREAVRVLDALASQLAPVQLQFREWPAGAGAYLKHGDPLPDRIIERL